MTKLVKTLFGAALALVWCSIPVLVAPSSILIPVVVETSILLLALLGGVEMSSVS